MFWTLNLSGGQAVHACDDGSFPWDFDRDVAEERLGQELIRGLVKDKKTRAVFMTDPKSEWHIYMCSEGLNPSIRCGKDNPVIAISALVGDFDTPLVQGYVENAEKLTHPPNWIEQSLSGNFRAIWLFESKLGVTGTGPRKSHLDEAVWAGKDEEDRT